MAVSQRYKELHESFRNMLPHVRAVSFDIFDTLFVRTLHEPEALFDLIGARLGERDFRQHRRDAQMLGFQRMKREGRGEINLADIYDHLPVILRQETASGELEQLLELDVLRVNPEVVALFHEARAQGKIIAWTSDMYLPESFFHELAERHDLLPDHYLVSSACGCTKRDDGALFDVLVERLGIVPDGILHIGDNPLGDVQRANERGLRTLHYKPPGFMNIAKSLDSAASLGLGLARYAAYHAPADAWWQLGWQFGGPIMLAFLEWVRQQAVRDGAERILFVARDGFLLHELHQQLGDRQVESVYLRGSRVSFSLAALNEENFPAYVPFLLSGADGITLADLFARIGVELPNEQVLQDIGLLESTQVDPGNMLEIERFICAMRPAILLVAREARRGLYHHLLDLGLKDGMRVAFVDVGWSGTTQKAFIEAVREMLPLDVTGYYLGLSDSVRELEVVKGLRMRVFAEDAGATPVQSLELYSNRAVVELFFSAPHPTTIGYRLHPEAGLTFVEDHERGIDYNIASLVNTVNTGIRSYIQEAVLLRRLYEPCDQSMALDNLLQLVCSPNSEQAHLIGELYNWDAWSSSDSNRICFVDNHAETGGATRSLWPAGFVALKGRAVGSSLPRLKQQQVC